MRKIRIKVKHLVYIVMGITVAVMLILPNTLFMYAKTMEKSNVEISKVYYKKYIEMFPFGNKRVEALYNLANSIIPDDSYSLRYKIFSNGSSSWGNVITGQMIDNAVNYNKKIIEDYKGSKYYEKAYIRLLNTLVLGGKFQEVQKTIDEGLSSKDEEIRLTALKFKLQSLMIGRKYEEARDLGKKLIEEGAGDSDIYMLLGDINFYDRKLDDAEKFYNKAAENWSETRGGSKDTWILGLNFGEHPYDNISLINKIKNGYKGSGEIRGSVIINGKPAPFVYVYVKNENDDGFNGIGDETRHIKALTDYNGNYVIPFLPDGNYVLGVGVFSSCLDNTLYQTSNEGYVHLEEGEIKNYDFTFVPPIKLIKPEGNVSPSSDKVELEWEKVAGAAYYYVKFITFEKPGTMEGNNVTFGVDDRITDTRFTLDINKVNMMPTSFMMDENGIVNPQAYLGAFYPGGRVPVFVEAYSSSGRLITSTRPIISNIKDMTMIDVPDVNLSEGDRLLLDRKPEKAINAYEKTLEKKPDDIHSMIVLSKLYSIGIRRLYEGNGSETTEGTNPKRAVELLERLYELTGENYYLKAQFDRFILKPGDYKEALERYKTIPESELDEEDFIRMAELSLMVKDYRGADMYYEKIYELKKDTNHYDLMPVILRLYLGDTEASLKFLQILDLRLYKVDKDKLYSDIIKLRNADKTTLEYKKFIDALKILIDFRDNKEYKKQFKDIYESTRDPLLSDILRGAGGYYNVFDIY